MTRSHQLIRTQWLPKPLDEAFAFFSRPENLQKITSPWLGFHLTHADKELHVGSVIEYKLRVRGVPIRWISEIAVWDPPHRFADNQVRGPYAVWYHEHTFIAEKGGTRMGDRVDYALPFGVIGELAHTLAVRRDVQKIFDFRQQRLAELLG